MQENGFKVINAEGDADLTIVRTAIESSQTSRTILVGDDTDLLILLLHYAYQIKWPILLKSEPKKGKGGKIWDILEIRDVIGYETCSSLLFAHAFLGCDTTSKPFGIGKSASLKLICENVAFKGLAKTFYGPNSTSQDIQDAGEKAMIMIYGGKVTDDLDSYRYKLFQKKVAAATVLSALNIF